MSALLIVAVSVLAVWLVGAGIYHATPMLSKPYRVKVITEHGYPRDRVTVCIVARFKGGMYGDRVTIAKVSPTDDDFDDLMAQALANAEQRVAVLAATQKQARRIGA